MQQVARGWFVYELTESALDLAFVLMSFTMPQVLLSLMGGVVADRFPKRAVMAIAQSLNAFTALVMGYLVFSGNVEFFHFILFGILNGSIVALSIPARHAIVPALVSESLVFSAIALNSTAMNIARVTAPAFAGVLIAWIAGGSTASNIGVGVVYFVISGLYLCASLVSWSISVSGNVGGEQPRGHVWKDMMDALRFVREHKPVWALVWLAIVPFLFGHVINTFLPAFNESVLGGGPDSLGLLLSFLGVGAILGSLTLASGGELQRKGALLVGTLTAWGLAVAVFGFVSSTVVALMLITFIGGLESAGMAMNRALTQSYTENRMLGRVMSIDMMSHGLMPLSGIPIGILADRFGSDVAISSSGVTLAVLIVLMLLVMPSVRHLTKR